MPFQKGQSGNPTGRPPKDRALTDLLEKAGKKTIEIDGQKVSKSRFLADAVWQAVTEKKVTLPNKTVLDVGPDDWWNAVRFIYKHVDGPPKQAVDVTSGGKEINTPERDDEKFNRAIEGLAKAIGTALHNPDDGGTSPVDAPE